ALDVTSDTETKYLLVRTGACCCKRLNKNIIMYSSGFLAVAAISIIYSHYHTLNRNSERPVPAARRVDKEDTIAASALQHKLLLITYQKQKYIVSDQIIPFFVLKPLLDKCATSS
ncbi:hypothetical protein ACJX0J_008679, partial [Zea mays]